VSEDAEIALSESNGLVFRLSYSLSIFPSEADVKYRQTCEVQSCTFEDKKYIIARTI
jgi:hypothetical protein